MSGLLAGRVWHSALDASLKPLAACLADEGNDLGANIYPSIAFLAWKLSVSERSVQRGMADLRRMGIIREVGKKKFGRIFLPVYFLDVKKLPSRRPWAEERRGDTDDVTSVTGDTDDVTSSRDGVTNQAPRGDTAVSPYPIDPRGPVNSKPAADAAADPCLSPEKQKELRDRKKIEARDRREKFEAGARVKWDEARREAMTGRGPEVSMTPEQRQDWAKKMQLREQLRQEFESGRARGEIPKHVSHDAWRRARLKELGLTRSDIGLLPEPAEATAA